MSPEQEPAPESNVERLLRIGRRIVLFLPISAPDFVSEHYRGAAETLDHELYDEGGNDAEQVD